MTTMLFTVLVHEAEEGGFWGEYLDLPGCVSQGETLDEMDRNIREAIEGVVEVKLEDGEAIKSISPVKVAEIPANVREWRISIPVPAGSSA